MTDKDGFIESDEEARQIGRDMAKKASKKLTLKLPEMTERRAMEDKVAGVHLSHCYQGEFQHSCKFGDVFCPAGPLAKAKRDKPDREEMTDWIYNSLKEIETEEDIKLSDRAFIADHLAPKLVSLFDGERE